MSISSLTCSPPVRRATRTPQLDYELFDQAVALFEEGKPRDAMFRVFRHLLPGHPVTEAPVGSFTLPQGSSNVTVRWDDVELWVSVPMVRLPAGGGTAALRFLLSKMSGTGQLHQPRLRGDDVSLEFHDRLAHLHPLKLLEVLRSMPVVADNNDDWMVDQFGVTLLERGSVVPLDDDEFARAEAIWHSHWSEVEVLFKEAQRKRNLFFLNEVTSYAVYHLRAALPLGGHLGARLWEAAATFNESNESPAKREAALTKCIKGMKAVAADDLRRRHPGGADAAPRIGRLRRHGRARARVGQPHGRGGGPVQHLQLSLGAVRVARGDRDRPAGRAGAGVAEAVARGGQRAGQPGQEAGRELRRRDRGRRGGARRRGRRRPRGGHGGRRARRRER